MSTKIGQKIVGYKVKSEEGKEAAAAEKADVNVIQMLLI